MRIGNKEDVNAITLKHKGKNLKFRCYIAPLYNSQTDLYEEREIEIGFDDFMEVNSLIEMLEKFKKESFGYIGEWRQWDLKQ